MGDEGVGVGAAGGVFQDGGVNFNEAVLVHKVAGGLPELGAADETGADLGIDVHINIAAAVAFLFVGEAVVAGEWAQALSEQTHGVSKNGDFAGAGLTDGALGFHEIAGV